MQDAITIILNRYDITGRYLDSQAVQKIDLYLQTGLQRIQITELINNQASAIIKEASSQLYDEQPELLRPGGNSYTTRRYSACLRDVEYYLRYATYAIIAGDTQILDERVLDGLRDTYNSLNVPIAPTLRVIQLLAEIIIEKFGNENSQTIEIIKQPFEYLIKTLSEKNI
uniref:allophycocyanin beta 18 subunit n=1 Tax=Rhodella violacea TaxID=2801 RepID=UPI001FCE25B9|nr:allophycocyanin beta 18 subunit [Rhodella violacea]UNJ18053.1 allophycocyanin beta 18 subunit [Rhodella violacea]